MWVIDFHGFGLSDTTHPTMGTSCVTLFGKHYPERMGLILVGTVLCTVVCPLYPSSAAITVAQPAS